MKRIVCHSGANTRITNEIIILNLLLSEIDFYKTALKNRLCSPSYLSLLGKHILFKF